MSKKLKHTADNMTKIKAIQRNLEKQLNRKVDLQVDKYSFQSRDEYFEKHKYIWDDIENNPHRIGYNKGLFRLHRLTFNKEATIGEIEDISYRVANLTWHLPIRDDLKNNCSKNCKLADIKSEDRVVIISYLEELVKKDLIRDEDFQIVFEDYYDFENYNEFAETLETLGCWTIYFKPKYFDEEIAYKCRLMPFQYLGYDIEKVNLLALGGYGMELSPKLDAYQALASGTIDKDSLLFSDRGYFEQIVGKEVTKEVLANTKLKMKKCGFEFYQNSSE